jgi:uncharacterized repeat protein (TIGR02543 family)
MIRTPMKSAAALLLTAAATVLFLPRQAIAHDKLGANLNFIGDFRRNHEFADLLKQSRLFLKPNQFDDQTPANRAAIGPDGWPNEDFRVLVMAAQDDTQGLAGVYKIVANGPSGVTVDTQGGEGTISNQTYDAATSTIRADLSFKVSNAAQGLMLVNFRNTQGQVKNVRIIRPGLNAETPPLLNPPWKAHAQRFPVIRFLDWTRTNGNRDVTWADRTTPDKRRTEQYIAQWETVIEAANWLNRDPWINVPVQANDEYVTNLAILLRDRLNANLNVYVEYGNELWNFGIRDVDMDVLNGGTAFNGATVNVNLAAASPSDSPLRFDGESNQFVLGFRRVGLRIAQISDIFRSVWGDAAINTRVRPVLAGQMANRFIVTEGLRLIDEGLKRKPDAVIYAISGAPYIFPSAAPNGSADEVPGLTSQQILDGLAAGVANAPTESNDESQNAYGYLTHAALGAWYGVKVVAYEAGFDNFGSQNIAAKRAANLDPQIRDICKNFVNQWHGFGFEHLLWFNAGADSYNTQFGMWPLVEDMTNQATPKNQCMDDILAAALPAITVGTPVLGAPIAGGNFRGSTNPTGTVGAAITPDFGFPGFVEYLLRADVEGTYSLVFTGTGNPGEVFRVLLNNATVSSSVQLPATQGNSAALSVTLRKGLNALRLQRVGGGSWVVNSFTFTLTGDSTPDAFSFTSVTDVTTGTVATSNAVTIAGITTAASVSVAGGEYSIGCTASFTSAAGTIANGQSVCVRHTAAASASTTTTTTLTVGGVSASFSSTTKAETPSTFALAVTNAGGGTVTSSPAGINCGATCTANITGGTLVTLTAAPNAGFAFVGWSGACTNVGTTCTVTMLGARSVTATFAANSTLTISRNGSGTGTVTSSAGGINCGTTCAGSFAAGASVALTAASASGSTFSGWGGACAGTPATQNCTVTMDASKTVLATFSVLQNTLTVTKAGGGTGTVTSSPAGIDCGATCAAGYNPDVAVTLTATPAAGSFFDGWSGACSGNGTCQVTMSQARSATATFKLNTTIPRLGNISTRGPVLTGNDVMIGGFVIGGAVAKKVLITARGPSLASFGVAGPLADPKIEIFSGQTKIFENDNWQAQGTAEGGATAVAQIEATGLFPSGLAPSDTKEAALMLTLNPGAYTAVVSGADGGTGVGIVEVFEQDKPEIPLVNISTRGQVQTGTSVMIGGFIISGDQPKTVLVTARGPSLAPFGIANPLANPKLEIFSGQTKIFENDDWETQAGGASAVSAIQATGVAPTNSKEAALLITLNPGAYTAIVSGVGGVTGVGIVEVFAR